MEKGDNGLYKGISRCKDRSDEVIERTLDGRMLGHVRKFCPFYMTQLGLNMICMTPQPVTSTDVTVAAGAPRGIHTKDG